MSPQEFIEQEEEEEDGEEEEEDISGKGRGGVSMTEVQRLLKAEMKRSLGALQAADRPTLQVNATPPEGPQDLPRLLTQRLFPASLKGGPKAYFHRSGLGDSQQGDEAMIPRGIGRLLLLLPLVHSDRFARPRDALCFCRIRSSPGGSPGSSQRRRVSGASWHST